MYQRLFSELRVERSSALQRHRLPLSFRKARYPVWNVADHAFPPLVLRCSSGGPYSAAETIACQIGTFTDAHAGVTNQQKSITTQIVAAEKFLLEQLILLCRESAWQPSGATWTVLAAD
jgi:hypothetical protein